MYQRNILGEWSKNKWVKEDDRAPGGYDMDEEGYRALAIFTGDIHGLDSYTLINEEKEQREKEERDQRRIELMKTLLDTKDDSQNTD